jgi:signal transduction histidine kinase
MGRTEPAGTRWAVAAIGVALLLSASVSPFAGQPGERLIDPSFGALLAIGVVVVGVVLARSTIDTSHLHVAAGWTLGGAVALAAAGAWTLRMHAVSPHTAQGIIGFELAAGSLAGSLVGAVSARSRQRATQLAEERERLSFLNYLLRHNVLNGVQVVQAQTDRLEGSVPEDLEHRIDVIDSWTTGLGELVGRMRQFLDTSTGDTELSATEIGPIIETEVAKVEGAFDADITTTGSNPSVRADDGLHQVFECLLVDAVERSEVSSPEISLRTAHRDSGVLVEVATPDPVASPDGGESFEPDANGEHAGDIGFGRYLVATFVDYYGGSVDVGDHDDDVLYTIELPHANTP